MTKGKNVEDIQRILPQVRYKKKVPPIRVITTGSMQRRFAITEETAIDGGVDVVAKVIKSRLLNANYCDLDFEETQEGLGYICNYLSTLGMLYKTTDASERLDKLLEDGSNSEKYNI